MGRRPGRGFVRGFLQDAMRLNNFREPARILPFRHSGDVQPQLRQRQQIGSDLRHLVRPARRESSAALARHSSAVRMGGLVWRT